MALGVMLILGLLVHDFIAEEPRRLGTRVGDECLFLGEFEMERFTQELSQLVFDGFGLYPWSRKTEQNIVGVAYIAESPIGWVVGVEGRYLLGGPKQLFGRPAIAHSPTTGGLAPEGVVPSVYPPGFTPIVLGKE